MPRAPDLRAALRTVLAALNAIERRNPLEQALKVSQRARTHDLVGPFRARVCTPQRPHPGGEGPGRGPREYNLIMEKGPFQSVTGYRCRDKDETTLSSTPPLGLMSIVLDPKSGLSVV